MKSKFSANCLLVTVVAALVLTGGRSGLFSSAQAQPAPPPSPENAQPASVAMPPNILPSSPLAEVIKLVQAGVDENIITSYVNNSPSTFNLDADKIIYLDNLGVPKDLVSTMMQRDQALQAQMAAASTPPPAPEPTPTYVTEVAPQPEPDVVTVNYFYSSLQPYGNWVVVPGYGRCWRPTVTVYNPGWQPYCDRGQWVNSDCGWYWNSDYSWGVTFHYGRWFRNANYGWCWWPDTVWAPSWVTWRSADAYCGWAPLPPFAVWQPGVGFTYRGNGVSVSFDFGLALNCYTFVPVGNFCDPHPRNYRCAPTQVTQIYNQTTVINNINIDSHNRTIINNGIPVQHITAATHTPIRQVPVHELRASAGQPWRNAQFAGQNHAPAAAMGNPTHASSGFENRNNFTPHGEAPANNQNQQPNRNWTAPGQPTTGASTQNHYTQPANGQTPPANRSSYESTQPQTRNFGDDKRLTSPRAQQLETPPPHYTPPSANNSAPMERVQPHVEPHPNSFEPAARASQPAPAPSSPPPSSSGKSDKEGQNGGGWGR